MKEINWIELMFRTLEGKASSSAQATGFEGDLCFAKILLLESFCWIPDIRNPAEDPLDMSEEGEEDYNGDSGIPALTSVPQPLILHPEVKGGSETTLSPSSEIPIAVGKPRIEDPQSWNSIPKSFSPWSGIQNRQSSDLSIAEGPDSRPLVWDKGQGVGGFITSGSGIDDAMVVPNSDDGLIRMSVEESKPSESMARISGSKAVDQKPMVDQGRGFVVHSGDGDVSGSPVRVPQYQIPEIQMPSVVDPRSLGSISDPGIAGYAQRDEASSPLVDERDVGIPGHQDRGEDFGAKVLPVIDEEVIDVGSDPKPISNIKPQVQGIQMPSVVDPGTSFPDRSIGVQWEGQARSGISNHMDKIHDGARGGLVEGEADLGAEVPPVRSLKSGIDDAMVVPNSDDGLIRMSVEESKPSESMARISGSKAVDQKPSAKIQDPGMADQGRRFVVHSYDEDVSGSQVRVPQYQIPEIQMPSVVDPRSLGSISDPGIAGYAQRDEASSPLVDGMNMGVPNHDLGIEVPPIQLMVRDKGGFITSGSGIDDVVVVPNPDDVLVRRSSEAGESSESMPRIFGGGVGDQKPSAKIQDPGIEDGFVVHSGDGDVSGSQLRVPRYQVQGIQRHPVIDPRSLGSISDPGIAVYGQRDEASSPLVDGRDVGIPGHRDRGEDFGAKVLPVIDEEAIDVGSDPQPISNIKPQVQGIQMPSVVDSMFPASISDPGITDYDHLGGTSTPLIDGRDVGFLNHMDKIHDGARGRLVEGRIDLGAEVPPARSLEPGIDEVMVVPNSDDVLIRMSSEEGRSSGSMPHISGGKVVDQKPMVDQGRGFVVHSGDEDVSGSQVRVPRYQVQGIQRHPVIDSQSSGVLSKNREPDLQVANSDIHPLIQDNKEGVSQSPFSDPQPVIHSANPVSYAFPKPDGKTLPFSSPYRWQEIHEVIERISNVISVVRGTSRRISRIELDISQEEWGKARVRLWTAGDRIFGIVEASDPKFKAILDFELPILKENLARSGVDIEFIAEGAGYRPDGWQMPEQREDMVWTRDPGGSWFGIQEASPEGGWSLDGHGSGHIDLWA